MAQFQERPPAPRAGGREKQSPRARRLDELSPEELKALPWRERLRLIRDNQERLEDEYGVAEHDPEHDPSLPAWQRVVRRDRYTPDLVGGVRRRVHLPKRLKTLFPEVPEEMRERYTLIKGFVQSAAIVIGGFLLIAILLSVLTQIRVHEPENAREVLASLPEPSNLRWRIEIARSRVLDGSQHVSYRVESWEAAENGKFTADLLGVFPSPSRLAGDGRYLLRQDQESGQVSIAQSKYPPVEQVLFPSPQQLSQAAVTEPRSIVSSKATVARQRGWLLAWRPSPALASKMLHTALLPLNGADARLIEQGRFRTVFGTITVLRNARRIEQIDFLLRLSNQAEYRVLISVLEQNKSEVGKLKFPAAQVRKALEEQGAPTGPLVGG